jgi:hypothetical protein
MSFKAKILAIGSVSAAVGLALLLIGSHSRAAEVVLPSLGDVFASPDTRIHRAQERGTNTPSTVSIDFEVPIVQLNTAEGNHVTVWVKAGILSPNDIVPRNSWVKFLRDGNFLLVNSADDEQTINSKNTTIGYQIGHGCNLGEAVGESLWPGEVAMQECKGGYGVEKAEYEPIGSYFNASLDMCVPQASMENVALSDIIAV